MMTLASQFSDYESQRETWSQEERSTLASSWIIEALWRVSPQVTLLEDLRSDQAEVELLYKAGVKSRPRPLMVIDCLIDQARSLSDLCSILGIQWVIRLTPHYDGSIGKTGLGWGLVIDGERESSLAAMVYMRAEDEIAYWQTLPQLKRPQIIVLSPALEEEEG